MTVTTVPDGRAECRMLIATLAVVLASGCARQNLPLKYVTEAQAAISAAEAVGANKVPKAQLHLKMARDQVETAERFINEKEADKARFMLMRARADAEVALALCREEQARANVDTVKEKLGTLEADGDAAADRKRRKREAADE